MSPRAAIARSGPPLALLLLAGACAGGQGGVPQGASLPEDAVTGAGDPARAAILGSAYAFGHPASLAGRPEAAARAAAQVEYLAAEIPTGPRWVEYSPVVGLALRDARAELRTALGIAPAASSQAVVDALYAASRALRQGDAEAAGQALRRPALATDGDAVLHRLAALPALPRTGAATALAQQEMIRVDQDGRFGGAGGSDGGKN